MKKTIKGLCVILSFFMLLSSIPLTDNLLFLSEAMVYYVPPGDVDNDGYATAEDARYILRASVGLEAPDETQKYHSDVDKNGKITAADARLVIRASVGFDSIGFPHAFEMPQVSGEASGKIKLIVNKISPDSFKLCAVAKNYAELNAANWKLSYNEKAYSIKKIWKGSEFHSTDSENTIDKLVLQGMLITIFNYDYIPGECRIGFAFMESLGISEETILFTAEFEKKADSSSDTEIVLYTADGRTEASLDISRLPGDTDNDMLATAKDARYIFRASVDLEAPDETQKYYSDVSKDGNITAADARLTLRASVGIEDIGLPSAFDVPQISGKASGKIRLRMSEITDNSFRVYAVAENYAELEAANWKLSYDKNKYSIKKIGRGSDPYKDDEGVINKLAADPGLLTEFVYYVNPGECLIGYAFRDSLGVTDEVILFTAEFEIKDDYSSGTKIELCTANGLTEAFLYTDQHLGDTDKDSYVTAYDARFILRASIGLETPDEEQKYYSDVDKNGIITAADARLTLRASVKLEDIGIPSAYEQPQISGAASEKLKLRISENIDNTIKVYAVAENYADLEAANWKLTYDKNNYSLRSLYTGSQRNDYDNSLIG
ncbi:MAG: hypothetical protein IJN70_03505, partial [Clostridia bacterium]|nr:hypothetical protein [Clostridia bacterium]